MPRRPCCKRVSALPGYRLFKPAAVPMAELEEIRLSVEELEALRLAHMEGLYQQQGAERMEVSRATFGRTLEEAHRKVTLALVKGCALVIEGGAFHTRDAPPCPRCRPAAGAPDPDLSDP